MCCLNPPNRRRNAVGRRGCCRGTRTCHIAANRNGEGPSLRRWDAKAVIGKLLFRGAIGAFLLVSQACKSSLTHLSPGGLAGESGMEAALAKP
jgi:hypothetical protein